MAQVVGDESTTEAEVAEEQQSADYAVIEESDVAEEEESEYGALEEDDVVESDECFFICKYAPFKLFQIIKKQNKKAPQIPQISLRGNMPTPNFHSPRFPVLLSCDLPKFPWCKRAFGQLIQDIPLEVMSSPLSQLVVQNESSCSAG